MNIVRLGNLKQSHNKSPKFSELSPSTFLVIRFQINPSAPRILQKQNSLQMGQIFSSMRTLVIRWFCFSRILQVRPLHHLDATPNPTLIPLQLAGLRGGLATGNLMRTLMDNYHDCELLNLGYTSK
jgi:hypothetical protein